MVKETKLELRMTLNKVKVIALRATLLDKAGIDLVAKECGLSISEYLLQLHERFKSRSKALLEAEQFARVQALVDEGYTCHGYKEVADGKRYYFSGPVTRGGIFLEPAGELKWFTMSESRRLDQYDKKFLKSLKPVQVLDKKRKKNND